MGKYKANLNLKEDRELFHLADSIADEVSDYFNVDKEIVFSKSKKHIVKTVRHFVYYILVRKFNIPLAKAGSVFKQDHATVLNAVNKTESYIELYEDYRQYWKDIKARTRGIGAGFDNPEIITHLAFLFMTKFPEQFAKADISKNDLKLLAKEFKLTEEQVYMLQEKRKEEKAKSEDKLQKHHTDELNKKGEQLKIPFDGKEVFGVRK